jgi:hypothetical protein
LAAGRITGIVVACEKAEYGVAVEFVEVCGLNRFGSAYVPALSVLS